MYRNLSSILRFVAPQTCDVPLDVAFMVESSDNMSPRDYQRIKDFVKEASTYLLTNGGEQQVGVILFNDEASIRIKFGQYVSEIDLNQAIDNLPLEKGKAQIDKALQVASTELFTDVDGARPGVRKVAIVLTKGKQPAAEDAEALKDAVRPLHRAGVRVIAIGVTSSVDWNELRSITEDAKDVIVSHSCDNLVDKVSYLFKRICLDAGKECSLDIGMRLTTQMQPKINCPIYQGEALRPERSETLASFSTLETAPRISHSID